ncbi:MAG TPA: CoA-acylating methylmalonate-semialdehyde dehydrogenase [Sedimenticola sp.]|nr:CoA-acylating methylmalonate-semialdehyde dehydrogenase [Sedimenticola sp.]
MVTVGHLINGELREEPGDTHQVFNPATGEVIRQTGLASRETVQEAIAAASAAFPGWRETPPLKRARVMFRFRELLSKNLDRIARLVGEEHGKILHDARGEVLRGIENVEYACYVPELLKGEHSRNVGPGIDAWSEFQPLGVVAGITPFNFPAMVPLWMYPLAIACGNCFVLKPSERDPSAPLFIAELLHEAGLPPGVMNLVNGGREAVDTLLGDPRVEGVSFVGSTAVAEQVYRAATAAGKRCQALGGAKNHAIVMPDADLEGAVDALAGAAFGSSGERCMALAVAVAVGEDLADRLVAGLKVRMQTLKVGPHDDDRNDFGALITREHMERVKGHIASAEAQGAEVVVDGRDPAIPGHEQGFFVGGTLIDRVTPEMSCYREEIFGPVLLVMRVASLEQGMALADAHEYGNGSCIFTRDGEAARYFTDHVRAGMVGVNVPLPVPVASHSFGGWKRSLFGDLAAYGPDGVRFYTRRKTITQRWPSAGVREGARFSFPA